MMKRNNTGRIGNRVFMVILSIVIAVAFSFLMNPAHEAEAKAVPAKVKGVKVVKASRSNIKLAWKKAKRAKKYVVYRAIGKKGKFKKRSVVKKNAFNDKKIKRGKTYRYYVKGYNGKYGKKSKTVVVKTPCKAKKPGKVTAVKSWYVGGNGVDYYDKYVNTNVKATLYSDGLLKVTGSGDVAKFYTAGPPWISGIGSAPKSYKDMIKRVSFDAGVRPTDISGWFQFCNNLTDVDAIPDSVKTLGSTFFACNSLKEPPKIPHGVESMSHAFYQCKSLEAAPALPASVMWFTSAFEGCENMTKAADIPKGAPDIKNAWNMYRNCKKLKGTINIGSKIGTVLNFFEGAATDMGAGLVITYDKTNPEIKATAMGIFNTISSNSKINLAE